MANTPFALSTHRACIRIVQTKTRTRPIMRTTTYAWLVAGSVLCQGISYAAGGSSLRGLKPPRDGIEAAGLALSTERSENGLDWQAAAAREDLAPRPTLYTGTRETRRFTAGNVAYTTSLHHPSGFTGAAVPQTPFDPRYSG